MELPSEIINIIQNIDAEPGTLVAFAAFHPFALIVLIVPLWILKKIGLYKPVQNLNVFGFSVVVIFTVGWLLGFVSQILLMFMGVSGLKMLMVYLSMYLCITAFVIVNAAGLRKKFDQNQLKKKPVNS
ncbi:hypothetical protein [Epilithonimonas caeni]|uniref:hypothetical protein n=1 Tax=Epilithonimonas caeni TaxID=365343 RepID=UPI0003FC8B3A|nr:hypothetical protein [Epilithonimonas caeni]